MAWHSKYVKQVFPKPESKVWDNFEDEDEALDFFREEAEYLYWNE